MNTNEVSNKEPHDYVKALSSVVLHIRQKKLVSKIAKCLGATPQTIYNWLDLNCTQQQLAYSAILRLATLETNDSDLVLVKILAMRASNMTIEQFVK